MNLFKKLEFFVFTLMMGVFIGSVITVHFGEIAEIYVFICSCIIYLIMMLVDFILFLTSKNDIKKINNKLSEKKIKT